MKLYVTGGREIGILVTWTNNFIEMAANAPETITHFSTVFLSNVQRPRVPNLCFPPYLSSL